VRPPDENQHGSTRPNLLSGARRRFGSDDNILERLERDSTRQASGNRSRAAWYAAAASLVLLLLVVVAWMAYENANTVQVIPMTRAPAERSATVVPPAAMAMADTGQASPHPHPVHAQPLPGPATVVQMDPRDTTMAKAEAIAAPVPVRHNAIAPLPPLVLLPGDETAAKSPATPAKREAPLPGGAAGRTRPVARASPPVQQAAVTARTAARTAVGARPRTAASASVPNDALMDRDVAVLSAIIMHDSKHADEKAQFEAASACARASERKCAGRAGVGQK